MFYLFISAFIVLIIVGGALLRDNLGLSILSFFVSSLAFTLAVAEVIDDKIDKYHNKKS